MPPIAKLLFGGCLTLAIVMGVGRFLYTPLLPLMQHQYGFTPDIAGLIAGANFAGYFTGSMLAALTSRGLARRLAFRGGLLASVVTTIAMGLTSDLTLWLILRLLSGMASAFAMIAAAGIVAEQLARIGEESRLAWVFGGVGAGIAFSGLIVHALIGTMNSSALWVLVGILTAILMPLALVFVRERPLPTSRRPADPRRRIPRPLAFWPLFASYTCQGLGYSVFATFIVALIKARSGVEGLGDWVWIVTGLAILPSCLVWSKAAERIGFAAALTTAYGAQIVGVMLPVVSTSPVAALAGAVLFGGTFIAITMLTMPLGRHGLAGRGFAVLTAGFGLGQMLGPIAAGHMVGAAADYTRPLAASAGVLALGLTALVVAIRQRDRTPAKMA
ncbi:YbfB/YjiJ family MFS transporter [Jiella sp. MQZ9-1]|uniref:YbfB/YjiJ family MFS transporter n=1 Tax=Jiella flava TaxID=2816857 RepID=A0A939FUP5_9HYPH|nr:YbfB/YjiJ family MFS transporter [Jiella flava]MBO0661785.1 YbfB/YjiJ family MFS transporter [Jiella flava]MCD2470426.1 YbfB/YjiJ family MFS transporter [Jiella flava]